MSPNKHQLRRPSRNHLSGSERTRLVEERINSKSFPIVWKVESDNEDNIFENFDMSEGKPVHIDIDKEATDGKKPTLALLPNRWEEDEFNNSGETRDGDGNISLSNSNRIFKPPEQLGSVPYF